MTMQTTNPSVTEMNLTRHCPLVTCGQAVLRGERIATANLPGLGDIHAPFAGRVEHVDPYRVRLAGTSGENPAETANDTVEPAALAPLNGRELLARLRELGADLPAVDGVDNLIINGVDEEPPLASRRTLLAEQAETLRTGLAALEKGYGPLAVALAVPKGSVHPFSGIAGVGIAPAYPSGLDPLVAKAVTGVEGPDRTVVIGLETVFHAGRIMETGLPVLETMVTVGDKARLMELGTPVAEILAMAGEQLRDRDRIVLGGVLRGEAAASPGQGVDRRTRAVNLVRNAAPVAVDAACVGCGECVRRCPARIDPAMITSLAEFGLYDKAAREGVNACFECGLCGYFCIARRPMLQYIRLAKAELAKAQALSEESQS